MLFLLLAEGNRGVLGNQSLWVDVLQTARGPVRVDGTLLEGPPPSWLTETAADRALLPESGTHPNLRGKESLSANDRTS